VILITIVDIHQRNPQWLLVSVVMTLAECRAEELYVMHLKIEGGAYGRSY
jgi:hypothetical protein